MKVSEILCYMNVEYVMKGDINYSKNIDLSNLNIQCDSLPTNNEFHIASNNYLKKILKKEYLVSIEQKLNTIAQEKSYDDRLSIASYYNSTNRTWAQESQKFCKWRDAVYEYALSILTQIENQEIEPPALQDFINNMPQAPW